MLTPTLNRPHTHQSLYEGFAADTWPNKELVVLDESAQASPFFSRLKDGRVHYHHEPGKPRIEGVTRIGAARNRLTRLAGGAYFEVRDDDDSYSPHWTEFALSRLGNADALKLTAYKLLHQATQLIFSWNSTKVSGKHWALLGDQIKRVEVAAGEMPPDFVEKMKNWYGFSVFAPRRTFDRFPFPEEGTEDIKFLEDIAAAGGRIVYVNDAPDMILHVVGSSASQHAYPDTLIGAAGADTSLAEMLQGMISLPDGQSIQITPAAKFAVLAAIDEKYSLRNIGIRAKDGGLVIDSIRDNVPPGEFGAAAPPDGMRLVLAVGEGAKAKTLPWKAPGFLAAFEKSHVVKAWSSSATTGAGAPFAGATEPPYTRPMLTGYASAIFGSGARDAGAGHATLMPAQPPGKQGPSYAAPPVCPQGLEWNGHECALVLRSVKLGAAGGDSGLCGANGSVADPAWSVCKWVQSGGDTSASQVSLGAAVDARRAYWLGVWRPLYQSGGCGNGYIKPQVETINGTQWLFSFSGYPFDIYVAAFHCPCPQGQYFNGNACIHQVVFKAPSAVSPTGNKFTQPTSARFGSAGYAAAIFGAGHAVSEGTKARGAAEVVERYDPKRYAGREPPHRCTVASATAIAQQLPGAPWKFQGELPVGSALPWPTTERVYPVVTPMGKKNIPVQVTADGQHISTTCPYTGAVWTFGK
jgi:hypothetical protein